MQKKLRKRLPDLEREKVAEKAKRVLRTPQGTEALNYLREVRKFSDAVIDRFDLGYVPGNARRSDGYRHEFAGRITTPIRDQYGRLVAISSRDWRIDAYQKFWHEQFDKSNYVYALDIAKPTIMCAKKVIVVEGEFDVMKMHDRGITCCVGVLGSAPSLAQIAILARYCSEIFFLFDGDKAGREAMKRVEKIDLEKRLFTGYSIRILRVDLPDGYDPDDYVKAFGAKRLIKLLKTVKSKDLETRGPTI